MSETQIFNMLNETEAGLPVNDVCHKYHVANSTYYKMKAKYAGMSLSDLKRLKALEQENQHLKAMYADISLEHKILKEVLEKKFRPVRRQLAVDLRKQNKLSVNQVCKMTSVSKTAYYYQPKQRKDDVEIEQYLKALAERHKRWGFDKMMLKSKLDKNPWNHKRVYRVYCELKLNLRIKPRKRLPKGEAKALLQPLFSNTCWSIDFMSDALYCGRKCSRTFNVIDDYNREGLLVEPSYSLPANKVTLLLDRLVQVRGILIHYIQPGKPAQNGFVERFNRTFREDVLDMNWFHTLHEVKVIARNWLTAHNQERSHRITGRISASAFCSTKGRKVNQ